MLSVLVTGGNGFLGRNLYEEIQRQGQYQIKAAIRRECEEILDSVVISDINAVTDWSAGVADVDIVIHTAARAHILDEAAVDPVVEFRMVNVEGTLNLARQAAEAGAKRFVFISSIGVNGNINSAPFTEEDIPCPVGAYALSKWEAEQGLWRLTEEFGMEVVIIRPPLIYGVNAPGNFRRLVSWVNRGVPLPLGDVRNKRTLVGLDNLVDLIIVCMGHPAAANQLFLAGDGSDVSTSELLKGIAKAFGKPSRLFSLPEKLLCVIAKLLGKAATAKQVLGSLQVDIQKSRQMLNWEPPLSVGEGLKRCCEMEEKG